MLVFSSAVTISIAALSDFQLYELSFGSKIRVDRGAQWTLPFLEFFCPMPLLNLKIGLRSQLLWLGIY